MASRGDKSSKNRIEIAAGLHRDFEFTILAWQKLHLVARQKSPV